MASKLRGLVGSHVVVGVVLVEEGREGVVGEHWGEVLADEDVGGF